MRRRADTPLPSADRWLLSWADFVTLLLALFAAMYAGAALDPVRSDAVARSVGAALGKPVLVAAPPSDQDTREAREACDARGNYDNSDNCDDGAHRDHRDSDRRAADDSADLAREIAESLAALGLGERVRVGVEGGAVGIDIDAGLLFREGDAALSDEARALLTEVAQLLRDRPHQIRVEGHTDSKPIANARHASNWELSSARAAVVVRQLASAGIAEIRMSAVGMAANRPLARNDTVEGRARNRRVHLVLLRQP